jgi:hypothetical protein
MKRFLKHIFFFGLLFFIIEKGLYFFIQNAPNKEYDKRLEFVLQGKMEKDIIIIGSSRGVNNISAKQMEDETGLSTYNLSYRGSNVIFHQFILETLLLYNKKPQKVLLVIDDEYEFLMDHSLHFRFDRLYPLKNYSYINNKLIDSKKKSYVSKFLYAAKIDREDFSLKPKRVDPINLMTSHGSKLLPKKENNDLEFINVSKNYNTLQEESSKIRSFKAIKEMCSSKGIDLYFVFTPDFKSFNDSFLKRFEKLVKKKEHLIVYDTLDKRYKDYTIFRDQTHMCSEGAAIFTSELSQFMKSKN